MADSTVGTLTAMKETPVSGLPGAIAIYDDSIFVLEYGGTAYKVTGAQLKSYAVAAAQNVNKGADGITPHIGENGNWYIGDVDTGVKAEGQDGTNGTNGTNGITPHIGENGHWYIGDTDTGISAQGPQGPSGSGTGDMLASVYDPNGKAQDIFAYVDAAIGGAIGGSY